MPRYRHTARRWRMPIYWHTERRRRMPSYQHPARIQRMLCTRLAAMLRVPRSSPRDGLQQVARGTRAERHPGSDVCRTTPETNIFRKEHQRLKQVCFVLFHTVTLRLRQSNFVILSPWLYLNMRMKTQLTQTPLLRVFAVATGFWCGCVFWIATSEYVTFKHNGMGKLDFVSFSPM